MAVFEDVGRPGKANKDPMDGQPPRPESDARSLDPPAAEMHASLNTPLLQQLVRNFGNAAFRGLANLRMSTSAKRVLEQGVPPLQRLATESVPSLDTQDGGTPAAYDRFAAEQRAVLANLGRAELFTRDAFNACQMPRSPMESAALADGEGPTFETYVGEALADLRPYVRHRRYLRRS